MWYAVELVRRPAAGPAVGIPRLCGGYSEEVREVWAGTSLLSALVLTQTPNREEPAAASLLSTQSKLANQGNLLLY